jgi:uncharacterized protein (TIGR04255 family)
MRIPRKIDDKLKDAIVNIQFTSGIPADAVVGSFFSLLKTHFNAISLGPAGAIRLDQLTIQPQQSFYIHKEGKFRVDITAESITFNLTEKYEGWNNYINVIEETLIPLFQEKVITKVNRIGVRYISIFDGVRIFDNIIPQITFAPLDDLSSRSQFRIELNRADFLAIVSIVNAYPTVLENKNTDIFSVVDIDIIKVTNSQIASFENVMNTIQKAHHEQKQLFFSLLKQEFIKSLNPEF